MRYGWFLLVAGLVFGLFVLIAPKAGTQNLPALEKRYRPQLVVQAGHKGKIFSTAFSPDGKLLASAGDDNTIKLWDVQTGNEFRTLYGHTNSVRSVAFSPDGKRLASAGEDFKARLWDVASGRELVPPMVHTSMVYAVAFSPDGKVIVTGGDDESISIWSADTGKFLTRIGEAKHISFDPDGKMHPNPGAVKCVAFSPTDNRFAWATADSKVLLLNAGATQVKTLSGHTATVHSLVFTPDGKELITASEKEVKFWNAQTGEEISGPDLPNSVRSLSISHDGRLLAIVDMNGQLSTVPLGGGEKPRPLRPLTPGDLRSVMFAPGDDQLATVVFVPDRETVETNFKAGIDGDYKIKLWNIKGGTETTVFQGLANDLYSMRLSPDGRKLAVGDKYSTVRIWNPDSAQALHTTSIPRSGRPSMAFSNDSALLAVGSFSGTAIVDASTGKINDRIDQAKPASLGYRAAFTPDGKLIVSSETDLSEWDPKRGSTIASFGERTAADWKLQPTAIAVSPTGSLLAAGSFDGTTRLWDIKNRKELRTTCGQPSEVGSVAFSPDGKLIVTTSRVIGATVKVCDTATGNTVTEFNNDRFLNIAYATFSPDSKFIAGIDIIGLIRLWNVSSGEQIRTFTGPSGRPAYKLNSVAFSRDGKILFSTSGPANVDLWNVETGAPIATLLTIGDQDWAVVTPDGIFDASDGAQALMHFVVSDPQTGYETISLDQLKSRFWVPGLLKKIFDGESLPTAGEFAVTLFPEVNIEQARAGEPSLKVDLKNRGGGIGRVEVRVNGSELTPDARNAKSIDKNAADVALAVDVPKEKLKTGENRVDVIAWNLEGDVQSRSHTFYLDLADNGLVSRGGGYADSRSTKPPSQIDYYAIVSGISDYRGDALDLRYAAKDAEDMARALTVAARKYFCSEEMAAKKPCTRVHVRLLSTETDKHAQFGGLADVPDLKRLDPVKENYETVFAETAKNAKADDVVTVYFSGHATSITTDEAVRDSAIADTYLYATRDAVTLDRAVLANVTERKTRTVSSLELASWLSEIKAEKKILILDTCAAGAVQKDLVAQIRDVDALQTKSIDRLRARTGFYVLMGSAANAQSYEANEYRQGLLTYSLLEGMTIDGKLRDGRFLDVEKWFGGAADRVEDLAKGIGGVQSPSFFKSYSSSSFDIGRIDEDDRKLVPLASRVPLLLEPFLFEKTETSDIVDTEGLTEKLETRLLEQSVVSTRGKTSAINYINASRAANGISPRGFYTIAGDEITVEISLIRDKKVLAKVKVVGNRDNIIEKITAEILRAVSPQV